MRNCENSIRALVVVLVLIVSPLTAQQTATATATAVYGFVVAITVTDGGEGYVFPPEVAIIGGGGSGAGAYATISNGTVAAITVTNAGFGYTSLPQVVISPPATTPFAASLVLDLPFDGSVEDVGPNEFPTTPHGGNYATDRYSRPMSALLLNGVDEYVDVPFNAALYPDEFTLSVWVKFHSLGLATIWRSGNAADDGWRGFYLAIGDNGEIYYNDHTGSGYNAQLVVTDIISIGKWYHIAVTRSFDSVALFVNGVKFESAMGLTPYAKPQSAAMLIGANYDFDSSIFLFSHATLDSAHIYNRALSDNETLTLYAAETWRIAPTLDITPLLPGSVRVNMQVVPNNTYQLKSSPDLASWGTEGSPFTATDWTAFQDFDASGSSKFFRLEKLP